MDALSDVLTVIRLKGGVFLRAEFSAPWSVTSNLGPEDRTWLPDLSDHVVPYHYVVDGHLWARIGTAAPVAVGPGEVVLFPHNDPHVMGSDPRLPPISSRGLVKAPPAGGLWTIEHGGGGARARILCGFLCCDRFDGNPLAGALPPLMTFDTRRGASADLFRSSFEFAAAELGSRRAGAGAMLAKLSEMLFTEALRRYVEDLPDEQTGWLAGLRDPFVSRALDLMHRDVAREWTVDSLGREAGLSRSALAERFTRLIGEPPMRYLARWRLQVAAHRLRTTDRALVEVAEEVGYESEAAFNRAFKREFGHPPAAWRRNRAA
jgi:AraC-like DNA-binding protein